MQADRLGFSPVPSSPSTAWLVTGSSAGFGRELVLALLARNIKVVATARKLEAIQDLAEKGAVVAQWDVTDSLESLQTKARDIDAKVGGVSVLVNNAGFLVGGTVEETSSEDTLRQFDTNVFGLINTTRAFLPFLRSRNAGTIVNISSLAGRKGTGGGGLYCASKFAVEGITESLAAETKHLGIRVVAIELGTFRTNFLGVAGADKFVGPIEDYREAVTEPMEQAMKAFNNKQPGDPVKGVNVIVDAVLGKGRAKGKELPIRLPLGPDAVDVLRTAAESDLAVVREWEGISSNTNHDDVA